MRTAALSLAYTLTPSAQVVENLVMPLMFLCCPPTHTPMKKQLDDTGTFDCTEQKQLNDAREAGTSHDQSRSRAYRWGEDGLGGISDDKQRLCFAPHALNERDPILQRPVE
jgi:hypothetical protein